MCLRLNATIFLLVEFEFIDDVQFLSSSRYVILKIGVAWRRWLRKACECTSLWLFKNGSYKNQPIDEEKLKVESMRIYCLISDKLIDEKKS